MTDRPDTLPDLELYLIRHAESNWNAENAHLIGGRSNEALLTARGEEQARVLGRFMLKQNIIPDRVYASPAVRTLETARLALEEMGLEIEVVVDDDLQEMDQGNAVGSVRAEVYSDVVLAELKRLGKDFKLPGAESMNDAGLRMYEKVAEIALGITKPERIFVFGHGMAIRCYASHLLGWSQSETYTAITDNTSVSLVTSRAGQLTLEYLGRMPQSN